MKKASYKSSGVDLDIYAESMARLPKLVSKTFTPRVMRLDGGFAGLFQLNGDHRKYEDPVLVSCTDGVGTKLKIACLMNKHDTIGFDLVAMSVNDAICCGAEPLFFLDYVAMPKDDPELLEEIVRGIAAACEECGCALIGGETAILSDLYKPGEYDLAGFCTGVAERSKVIDGKAIEVGDQIIGVASSGFHSNGYSLIRQVVFDMAELSVHDPIPELGQTVGEVLLEPTRLYVRPVLKLLDKFVANQGIRGIAHITGGGLEENFGRILPQGKKAIFEKGAWPIPPMFRWLQKLGNIDDDEMERVFNCGLGLALAVPAEIVEEVQSALSEMELDNYRIGSIASV